MRIAIFALALGGAALVACPPAAAQDGIVKQGASAVGATAGTMAGTLVGGPVGGALGGVVGGAVGRTSVDMLGAVLPGGKKKKVRRRPQAEVEAGPVQPQVQAQIEPRPPSAPHLGDLPPLEPVRAESAAPVSLEPIAPAPLPVPEPEPEPSAIAP